MLSEKFHCYVRRVRSEAVCEMVHGKVEWQGTVAVFELVGHPEADTAYVWEYEEYGHKKTMVTLKLPPVDSAQTAVRITIAGRTGGKN